MKNSKLRFIRGRKISAVCRPFYIRRQANRSSDTRLRLKANESLAWRCNQRKVTRKMRISPPKKLLISKYSHFSPQDCISSTVFCILSSSRTRNHTLSFIPHATVTLLLFFMPHTKIVGNEREGLRTYNHFITRSLRAYILFLIFLRPAISSTYSPLHSSNSFRIMQAK